MPRWTPADQTALPSPEEIGLANQAISELTLELEKVMDTVNVPRLQIYGWGPIQPTRTRIVALMKEIQDLQAWKAPIRKLPVEILSQIFVSVAQVDPLGPVVITEVCRLWRQVVISTPRAWIYIYLTSYDFCNDLQQYFVTFAKRSDPYLLHLFLPEGTLNRVRRHYSPHPLEAHLQAQSHRIQCLTVPDAEFQLRQSLTLAFPRMDHLYVASYDICPFSISAARFPHLRYLDCFKTIWSNVPAGIEFPPLQYLSLLVDFRMTWVAILQGCSATLKRLKVSGRFLESKTTPTARITFPILEHLEYSDCSQLNSTIEMGAWPIEAITPRLTSYAGYVDLRDGHLFPTMHTDVKHVTHLDTDDISRLASYTSLHFLQILAFHITFERVVKMLEELEEDRQILPAPEKIHIFRSPRQGSLELAAPVIRIIEEKVKSIWPNVDLTISQKLIPMPHDLEELECAPDMPCRSGYR